MSNMYMLDSSASYQLTPTVDVVAPRRVMGLTILTPSREGKRLVGWSRDLTHSRFDEWRRNGSGIEGGWVRGS